MEIKEYLKYRVDLLNESKDEDGFINETNFINNIIPSMLDAKLIDTEDFTETYYSTEIDGSPIKINGYIINDSGERLQLFILNDESISLDSKNLEVSIKEYYETIFKRATNFTNKSIKGHLNDIQDIGAINALINQMSSSLGADQFDVVEIFLISATATVTSSGSIVQPKRMDFKDEKVKIRYTKNRESIEKEILILKRLVDLNFLYSVLISQGNREALTINFEEQFDFKIEAIKAADETNFESYLCVLPANILAELYKRFSSRLLEKNVRSFLQFRGVNLGMRKTLTKDPEKFIAFNNGLTITASNKEIETIKDKIYIKSLSDFQIVNGGQTTASIYFSQKDGIDVSKVKVMAKINVAKNVSEEDLNELISNISEFSNSQSKVTTVDLRSRNPQLNKIKALSESIITPSGRKWFFEKSKGEFNTKLRIAGQSGKNRIEKEYPKEFRFTKEQLGKYYSSWGDEPYKVKKGGEAIFRKFLEDVGSEENEKKLNIDRNFYELLISRIILFKSLEEIHGTRNNAIGQLRSAVVPYTMSILFSKTEGDKRNPYTFDLAKLWAKEGLEDDLKVYLKELMILVNDLIKKYAKSDDLGEYSKKKEMWDDIYNSNEIKDFLNTDKSNKIFNKYSISKKELEKKLKANSKNKEVDFKFLKDSVDIHSKTPEFYKKLNSLLWDNLTDNERNKFSNISALIQQNEDLTTDLVNFENNQIQKIRINYPDVLDKIVIEENTILENTLNYVVKKYNSCIEKGEDIISNFDKIGMIAKAKGIKYDSVFNEIGKKLKSGEAPNVKQLYYASNYISTIQNL
ncbi:AIPR family protein [Flavobacterium cheniae]|uniref:AIPR protein n=1 Tax=Flavobacterium cheniae TaxID=295428 RepID=A0A562KJI7_9FLAO|nr:AIPR family protein [Flavobacterium cheniae]TDR25906.1 AIPR protein [Flavobacterium cheniae]TWH95514.1 AIPR protein [Flavobacterium cheniae]